MLLPLRDENPTLRFPGFTVFLLAANLCVFIWTLVAAPGIEDVAVRHGFTPGRFGAGPGLPWSTLGTSMFLHADVLHLGGNLLFLWIFGNNVEDALGHLRFALFYGLVGLGGHLAHGWADAGSVVPTIGASGAISGILAAYLLRYPRTRVTSLLFLVFYIRLVRVPAIVVIGLWLAQQVLQGAGSLGGVVEGNVAWFEHLGGFLAGLLLFPLFGGKVMGWRKRRWS